MATLYVIAGPNGAGKSTISAAFLKPYNISAFDYDKELHRAWQTFGFDPLVEEGVRDLVGRKFLTLKNTSIQEKKDFAFETNYHHDSVVQTVKRFKEAGHRTQIIFIALPNAESAIARVKRRIKEGGHSVDEQTIRERYRLGIEQLDRTFEIFDRVQLHMSKEYDLNLILSLDSTPQKGPIVYLASKEFMKQFPMLNKFACSVQNIKGKDDQLDFGMGGM